MKYFPLLLCLVLVLFSCDKQSADINALYAIYKTNPDNKLEWEFDDSDPQHIKMIKHEGVTFSLVDGQQRVTELRMETKNIENLEPITALTALTYLSCGYNQLTTLDVSHNTALTYLCCYVNQLTSLDVSKNTLLIELYSDANQLTILNVNKNIDLEYYPVMTIS